MRAVFVELPAFERHRPDYLDDEGFARLQEALLANPDAGDVIKGSGGLRIIYFWWAVGSQVWLFTLYDKDEMDDLPPRECKAQRDLLKRELDARSKR